jgi:inosose dehydratase
VSVPLRLAGAPITWGVCEVPGWGVQLDRERVLEEIASAGLTATELGPRGFLSDDPAQVRAQLASHGLTLVGGFVPAVLHRAADLEAQLVLVEASARTLAGAGAEVLVLAAETGSPGYESSLRLSEDEWAVFRRGVTAVQEIGTRHGLIVALHPHYGTLIESEDSIRRLLETTDVPLCLDTGHLLVGGADPLQIARLANGRIAHVHLKDVDAATAARVRSGEVGYRDAVRDGLYRPLGEGDAAIASVVRSLTDAGYRGWFVIEQDLVIRVGSEDESPLRNAIRSVRFLEGIANGPPPA